VRENVSMASALLLRGRGSEARDRWPLEAGDEEAVAAAARELVAYTADPTDAPIAHERDGQIIAAWDVDGARRLAQLLPPAYAELSEAILERHRP
jgi:hypothetical protein